MAILTLIAQGLEDLYGDYSESEADFWKGVPARHFAEVQTSTGTGKLVRYSWLSGDRALVSYACENALAHFERGLIAHDITLSSTSRLNPWSTMPGFARTRLTSLYTDCSRSWAPT